MTMTEALVTLGLVAIAAIFGYAVRRRNQQRALLMLKRTHKQRYPHAFIDNAVLMSGPLLDLQETVSRLEEQARKHGWPI